MFKDHGARETASAAAESAFRAHDRASVLEEQMKSLALEARNDAAIAGRRLAGLALEVALLGFVVAASLALALANRRALKVLLGD